MLGLDSWNGSRAQVEGFRANGGITLTRVVLLRPRMIVSLLLAPMGL